MSRKGHYSGGSTIIRPWDSQWFKKGATRVAPNVAARKKPLSLTEQAALKGSRETGTQLIPQGTKKQTKKPIGKAKTGRPKPPIIKAERSEPNRTITEVRQAQRYGQSRVVAVEFVSRYRSQRAKT